MDSQTFQDAQKILRDRTINKTNDEILEQSAKVARIKRDSIPITDSEFPRHALPFNLSTPFRRSADKHTRLLDMGIQTNSNPWTYATKPWRFAMKYSRK